jgi:DUF4097 and DUF4098 domain-containing protein YvlB
MKSVCIFVLVSALPAATLAATVDERIEADSDGQVIVRNMTGDIVVSGWDQNAVRVTGEISDQAEGLDVHREGNRVVVEVIFPESWQGDERQGGDTDLRISVPRDSELDVETVSADVSVSGVAGEQRLISTSGDIDAEDILAEARFETVSGDIRVTGQNAVARTSANAVSGDIGLNGMSGEISVAAVSGDIRVVGGLIDRAELDSVSGDVDFSAELGADARIRATSTSGDIRLVFAGNAAAEYDLSSFSGDIQNCFGPSARQSRGGPPSSALTFTEGDSDARVDVSTLSGDIEVCR